MPKSYTLDDVLQGRPLTVATLHHIQRTDKRIMGANHERDGAFEIAVQDAFKEIDRQMEPRIPFEKSKALNMMPELNRDSLIRMKMDPRYSDPGRRDPEYVRAVDAAVKELAADQTRREQEAEAREAAEQGTLMQEGGK